MIRPFLSQLYGNMMPVTSAGVEIGLPVGFIFGLIQVIASLFYANRREYVFSYKAEQDVCHTSRTGYKGYSFSNAIFEARANFHLISASKCSYLICRSMFSFRQFFYKVAIELH